jgi:hypothetical protein
MRIGRMSTGRFVLWGLFGTLATFWAASCQGPEEFLRESVTSPGSGGASGTGGTIAGSGGSGTGGASATGGAPATGGVTGTGGIATGGVTGTGGIIATGGVKGTGGIVATGGVPGTGGIVATGGVPGTGGRATGGVTGTGGIVATGGVPGTGGTGVGGTTGMAGTTGTAKNCADAIKLAGYSAGTAPPCSACKENGADKSTNCMKVIDCLDANYPCGSNMNCALQCNNAGPADSVVTDCVNKLLTAGACVQP